MSSLQSYNYKTDQGPYLQINEDLIDVDLNNKLFMLLDGFGGASIGDKAVSLIRDKVKTFYTKVHGDPDSTLPFSYNPKYLVEGNALINAVELAHQELKKNNQDVDINLRGGASGIFVAQSDSILTLVSVGNCKALLYSKGVLKEICIPDNFEFISGDLNDTYFSTAPMSGFGLFDVLTLSLKEIRIQMGDKVILLSDGIYSRVTEGEILDTIRPGDGVIAHKIDDLFSTANSRGNMDNQSILLLNF